jgi:uncharacterized alpha-E superfamily protein
MLSRVAESLYWVGRLVERTGHVAQLLDVHLSLWLDRGQSDPTAVAEYWQQLLALCADPADYARRAQPLDASEVSEYVIAASQPGGILASLNAARDSARGVRESLSSEVWEFLNSQHWQLREASAGRTWEQNPHEFLHGLKTGVSLFYGLIDETMLHDESWCFLGLGRFYERALNTARLLDVKYQVLSGGDDVTTPSDPIEWAAILRCCWAFEAYRRYYASAVQPTRVAEFLLLNPAFPRSMGSAIRQALALVHQIGSSTAERSGAERGLGTLHAQLDYATIDELLHAGLHEVLDGVRRRCLAIEQAVYAQYFQGRVAPLPVGAGAAQPLVVIQEQQ